MGSQRIQAAMIPRDPDEASPFIRASWLEYAIRRGSAHEPGPQRGHPGWGGRIELVRREHSSWLLAVGWDAQSVPLPRAS